MGDRRKAIHDRRGAGELYSKRSRDRRQDHVTREWWPDLDTEYADNPYMGGFVARGIRIGLRRRDGRE